MLVITILPSFFEIILFLKLFCFSCLILIVFSTFFQGHIPASPKIYSPNFWCFFLTTKTPCSNFHFYLPRSDPYFSRVFSSYFDSLHVSSPFTYTPDVHSLCVYSPHLFYPFFLVEQFLFQNTVSFVSLSKTFVFHSVASFIFFFHLSLWNPFSFSSPFCSSFFHFAFFPSCSFEKTRHCSKQKTFSSNITKNCFSEVLFFLGVEIFQKLFFHRLWHFEKWFWTSEKRFVFTFVCFEKSYFFLWKMGNTKKIQISFFGNLWSFQKKLFFRKHVILDTKQQND